MEIPIVSDSLSAKELHALLSAYNKNEQIKLVLEEEPAGSHMSGLDPEVVKAIIEIGGVVFSSLITMLIAIYTIKSNKEKTNNKPSEQSIEIKLGDDQLKFPTNLPPDKVEEMKQLYQELKVSQRKLKIDLSIDEKKQEEVLELIEALEIEDVRQITILED